MKVILSHPITRLAAGAVSLLALLSSAPAAILYYTGFENPPFPNNSELLGQDGWSTAIPPFLNPSAALITNTIAKTGAQSVAVSGASLTPDINVAPITAVGSYRRPIGYDASTGSSMVLITCDVRLDGPLLGTGDFFSANIAARSGDGGIGELSISSDGMVYGYNGAGPPVGAPISLGEWHNLGIRLDFAADTYTFLVDGTLLGTFNFDAGFTSDTLVRAAMVAYVASPDSAGVQKSDFTARYDNFSVSTVPEPGATGSLFLASLALLALHRRSHLPSDGKTTA